jgi:hypothetical protein
MVERHIFSPEPDFKGSYKSPLSLKLEKDLIFSGVIISSQGKWAMIRETGKGRGPEKSGLHKEGDEIKGMVIKEINSNFLILEGQDKEVRLYLYHEGKQRPSAPSESATPDVSTAESPADATTASAKSKAEATKATASKDKPRNALAEAMRRIMEESEKEESTSPPAVNPFLEAIRKAEEM